MFNAKQLREELDACRDEVDAIVAVATKEERELTDEENSQVSDLVEKQIPSLEKRLENRLRIDAELQKRSAARMSEAVARVEDEAEADRNDEPANRLASVKVPAKARSTRPLKAYENEKDAYVAGNVILAGLYNSPAAVEFCNNHGLSIRNTMQTGDNSKGGFVTTEEMQRAIIRLREELGVFPRFANSIPMGADIIKVPRLLADVTAYWGSENGELTASDATLGSAELMARKLYAMSKISTELDEDAVVDIGDMITTSMAYKMAEKIDEAGFNGDGTSDYGNVLGLKNALDSNAIQDAATGNTGALTLDLADFEAAVGKYPQYPGASPRWFVHSAVYWASMARLMDAAGGNTVADLGSGPQMQFLGYPVTFTQVMPSTTGASVSTILAYFGDLRLGATVGTRRSMRTEVSAERYFEFDQIAIKTTERIAINVHERGDTIRTRPIVALKTSAS